MGGVGGGDQGRGGVSCEESERGVVKGRGTARARAADGGGSFSFLVFVGHIIRSAGNLCAVH